MSVDNGTLEWFKKNLELIENGIVSGMFSQPQLICCLSSCHMGNICILFVLCTLTLPRSCALSPFECLCHVCVVFE